MWEVENQTPFAVDRGWVRDRDGSEVWLIAVKATFQISDDGSSLRPAKEQLAVLRVPELAEEGGSVRYDADLVLTKRTTDVILNGHAIAPEEKTVRRLDVSMRVGPVQKSLRVHGERCWERWGPSESTPFKTMPLVYERAFGGSDPDGDPERDRDPRNPVGCGLYGSRSSAVGRAVPNIESIHEPISSWDDRPSPAGFGAIGSHWWPRSSFAGTYDDAWLKTRHPLLPHDFDERFFQCAPADQQAPRFLSGGEEVDLVHLTRSGRLRFTLPRLHLGFETQFYDGTALHHQDRRLHTVIVEPDHPRVSLVWHSALPCHFKVHKLQRTTVTLKRQRPSAARHPEASRS